MAKKQIDIDDCQNCRTHLNGEFCHVCGQSREEPRRAVVGLVQDVFVDTLAIDGRFFRTLFLLITAPGRLARRYLDGRRVHYSPPFRLYLFASVFFFFFAFWIADFDHLDLTPDLDEEETIRVQLDVDAALEEAGVSDSIRERTAKQIANSAKNGASEGDDADANAEGDDANSEDAEEDDERIPFKDKKWSDGNYNGPAWLEPHAKRAFEAAQRAVDDPRLFVAQTRENLPRVLLIAPIVYSLILLIFYFYRRKFLVYDHLVISLFMHAALYTYLLLAIILAQIPGFGPLAAMIPLGWGLLQPFAVFRQAYRSNWFSVVIKGFLSTTIYFALFVLIITFGITFSLYQS